MEHPQPILGSSSDPRLILSLARASHSASWDYPIICNRTDYSILSRRRGVIDTREEGCCIACSPVLFELADVPSSERYRRPRPSRSFCGHFLAFYTGLGSRSIITLDPLKSIVQPDLEVPSNLIKWTHHSFSLEWNQSRIHSHGLLRICFEDSDLLGQVFPFSFPFRVCIPLVETSRDTFALRISAGTKTPAILGLCSRRSMGRITNLTLMVSEYIWVSGLYFGPQSCLSRAIHHR